MLPRPLHASSEIPNTPQPIAKRKIEWPQSVRDYVQRSFAPEANVPGVSKEAIEAMLKKVINEAAENNALYEVRWETYPLPQELIQRERLNAQSTVPQPQYGFRDGSPTKMNGLETRTNEVSISKKRKSSEMTSSTSEPVSVPPWEKPSFNGFENRITYASPLQAKNVDKRQKKILQGNSSNGSSKYQNQADLERRKQRFFNAKSGNGSPYARTSSRDESPSEGIRGPVIGTCQNLEKNFFRLTAEPKSELVRPLEVLKKTLELLKTKWRHENNYSYICDQFKSLRQDLTVQHIRNEFTVTVYEIHARIALERTDLGEYNQCQTQLRALYSQKLGGHPAEFLAYRILYFIHTCNRTDMNDLLADLTETDKDQPAVKHALEVRAALAAGNFHKFFKLYLDTPNMGAYLMDMFVERERLAALAKICKA